MSIEERQKLETLLKQLADKNREQGSELRKLAETASEFGKPAHDSILSAAQQLDRSNEYLAQALNEIKPRRRY